MTRIKNLTQTEPISNLIHRDIKPENILLDEDLNIKLTDFGFSKKVVPGRWLREVCGTPGYLSPEILQCGLDDPTASFKGYRFEVDMWACGVVLYSMLGGNTPFWNRRQHKMVRLIISGTYHFDTHIWDQGWWNSSLMPKLLSIKLDPSVLAQGYDQIKYYGSPNLIQNQIRLVLLVLTDTMIQYHYGKISNFVFPNQIQIQIGLVLLVRTDTRDDRSQPCTCLLSLIDMTFEKFRGHFKISKITLIRSATRPRISSEGF